MAKRLGRYFAEQLILKITLIGSDPEIWRRVEVHSGLTLDDLHYVIQDVFEWENDHLYHFLAPPGGKLTRRALAEAKQYDISPDDSFSIFGENEAKCFRTDEALVGNVLSAEQKQIIYEYDFGDSWEHLVKVEKRTPGGDQGFIPVCLAGENAAPYDDMGGIGRYYDWLEALRDKRHEMHEDAIDWLGKGFDPAKFDLEKANKRLKATFKPVPKKPKKPRKKRSTDDAP
jgi:hypothetical protein